MAKLKRAMQLPRERKVSIGRACGGYHLEMIEAMPGRGVHLGYTVDELRGDVKPASKQPRWGVRFGAEPLGLRGGFNQDFFRGTQEAPGRPKEFGSSFPVETEAHSRRASEHRQRPVVRIWSPCT
ncbi:MAG: hypothetical protein QMC89_05310 [Candidatus Hodarchaeaceae archaeon]|nr:hypothetical protein [Candidatus Hodarchaeaceae archaeon]